MAARYVAALLAVQPSGPYLLGGWSLGGIVAYEMARQLREAGETIDLLALIDARAPAPRQGDPGADDLALLVAFAQNLGLPLDQLPLTVADVQRLSPDERLARLVEQALRFRLLPPDVGVEQLGHLFHVFAAHVRALERYTPRPYDGRLTLYRAARGELNGHDALGWKSLALKGVAVREIPGTHFTVLREPHVAELAARLAEDLP
jgi:thioesterase domain-containing protein